MKSRFVEARHPNNGTWQCGECETHIQVGQLCPTCGTILCEDCEPHPHAFPSGARAGKQCPESNGVEDADAA